MTFRIVQQGDIFSDPSVAYVNAVNCRGVMGAGIAKAFAQRFPDATTPYHDLCRRGGLEVGRCLVVVRHPRLQPQIVIHCATMTQPGERVDDVTIAACARALARVCVTTQYRGGRVAGIASIAIPAIGCGIGKQDPAFVAEALRTAFREIAPETFATFYAAPLPRGRV